MSNKKEASEEETKDNDLLNTWLDDDAFNAAYQEGNIKLENFEPGDEPDIRPYNDGSFHLMFASFPPVSWKMRKEHVKSFRQELIALTGVEDVVFEERQYFYFPTSNEGTIDAVKNFINSYKQQHGYV